MSSYDFNASETTKWTNTNRICGGMAATIYVSSCGLALYGIVSLSQCRISCLPPSHSAVLWCQLWLFGSVCSGRVLDLQSSGRGFDSRSPECRVQPWTNYSHTWASVTEQHSFRTSPSWEGNRRSAVPLAMRHRQYRLRAHGLRKGDEHPRLHSSTGSQSRSVSKQWIICVCTVLNKLLYMYCDAVMSVLFPVSGIYAVMPLMTKSCWLNSMNIKLYIIIMSDTRARENIVATLEVPKIICSGFMDSNVKDRLSDKTEWQEWVTDR